MLKKLLPLAFLAALIGWGIYDYIQSNDRASQPQGDEKQAAEQTDRNDTGEKIKTGIENGDQAPDFTLKTLDGESMKLSDFRGKKVIVNFWATWCPPCREEMPELQSYYKKHQDEDITVLGVDLTSTEQNKSDVAPFVEKVGTTFPIVLDEKGDVAATYEVTGYPTSYFIDEQGVIQYKLVGAMNTDVIRKAVGKME